MLSENPSSGGERWVVVLGAGFVGSRLAASLALEEQKRPPHLRRSVLSTHRSDFDITEKSSWSRLPEPQQVDAVVVTFPCCSVDHVKEFHEAYLSKVKMVIVYGSTSRYIVNQPDEQITEEAQVDLSQPRVQGEEYLRGQGAVCLVLAGIYGDERQPSSWLIRGLIKNGNKHVNLVHVSDILAATLCVINSDHSGNGGDYCDLARLKGQSINVSDGTPRRWHDILAHYRSAKVIPAEQEIHFPDPSPPDTQSKRISNNKLRHLLGSHHHFVDLFSFSSDVPQ